MVLINQQVVILDNGTGVGETTARMAVTLGAKATLVRHQPGAVLGEGLPGGGIYPTIALNLSRPEAVDAWLAAFPAPIDHLLIGHLATSDPLAERFEEGPAWPGGDYRWAEELALRWGPGVVQSVALFTGPVVIAARPAAASIAAQVGEGHVRGLATALRPRRVNAVWTEPVRSPLPADAPVQVRQALYLSAAPHTRSRADMREDVGGALLFLMSGMALTGSVLRISHDAPVPVEAW
jgi:hypothetical protein